MTHFVHTFFGSLHLVHTFCGAQNTLCELFLGCYELPAHFFLRGSHFVHTFQGSVPESARTSFAPCAHCPSACRVPGPARRSIRPTCLDKIRRIVFIYSGIRASGEAHGVLRPRARRPGRRRMKQPSISEASCCVDATRPPSRLALMRSPIDLDILRVNDEPLEHELYSEDVRCSPAPHS